MGEYIVTKTLNNNVVVCTNDGQEVILIGKGIGFNKKEGMVLNNQAITIDKIYKLESEQQKEHYKSLVEIADDNVLQVIIESLNFISNTAMNVDSKQLVVSLTDHIIFAYKRIKQNQVISNPFVMETKQLYSEAYHIAKQVIDQLNDALDVHFPEDEIGFIALHIASNTEDLSMREMTLINDLIKRSIDIIESDLVTTVDKQSLQYQRFIRHVQFLIRRLRKKEYIHAQDDFVSMIKNHYPICYNTAFKILTMIQKQFDVHISESEIIYLTLHIHHFEAKINQS
ncbi:TPA: transcription antiterminator [Staphylococcus argenteus]|uniref:glucose PTS transporter transcription antiterminator GlcT n=1 Tax=Staphylococcus argenteus TaxID=985002 RepID=UPI0005026514|nr:transcription antiterminator [Staphylococcus argenteus]MBE2135614.1 transcription antiterminator [Staphylococcus argenteus]MDT3004221.1 transcription antiterminator [Staphylococcus argenteus]UPO22057.1 transcription antiterminator [Staphylococcus argenteus]CDR63641.1 BglG family transcription antiterminator [Staphylococcus argenteus]HDY9445441.1 transcription antiterminator [Staphylococcus argenteus]